MRSDKACEFLLTSPNFIRWYETSSIQQLVIVGGMGCGKTVAMTFLVDELNRRNEHQLPRPKLCYYYCRDAETGQAVDVLCTLTLALLEQLSGLKKVFYEWYKENQSSGSVEPTTSVTKLTEFLAAVLKSLDRPLFFVIDGLDECDRSSRLDLVKSLTTLSCNTSHLKVIFSSRSDEEVMKGLQHAAIVNMHSDPHRDAIIVRHIVANQLSYLPTDVRQLVIEALSQSARGSAIWTKMIVELIELRRMQALEPVRLFLQEMPLPMQLSKLYASLLSRGTSDDTENQGLAIAALKLLSVARRPLSIQEVACAVAFTTAAEEVTTVADLTRLVDRRRVMSLIHPFITRVDAEDTNKRQVQIIHQSVREFIEREHLGLAMTPDRATSGHRPHTLESFILDLCIKYLLLDEIGRYDLFSEEQIAIEELPQESELFGEMKPVEYDPYCRWEDWEADMIHYDPTERGFGDFFVYASSHWLDHFGAVETGPLPSLVQLESLCQANSTRLRNWIDQSCRPDCAIKARFEFESHLYDPLSITSLYGSNAIFRWLLECSDFTEEKYHPLSVIGAADQILQWGDLSRLTALFLEARFNDQLRNLEFFRLVIRQWNQVRPRHDDWELAFSLVDHVSDRLVEDRWGYELLCVAARAGCVPMLRHLSDLAQRRPDLKFALLRESQSTEEHAIGNDVDVVGYLLQQAGYGQCFLSAR